MPSSLSDRAAAAVLSAGAERIVPLICLADESEFGKHARAALDAFVPAAVRSALRCGAADTPGDTVDDTHSQDFSRRLVPLLWWENQPAWCVWFCELTLERAAAIAQALASFEADRPMRHVLFLKVSPGGNADALEVPATNRPLIFLLNEDGAMRRDTAALATGAAACAFVGWRRFCAEGDGHFENAMGCEGSGLFTLGISINGVDSPHHAARWAARVTQTLRNLWLEPSVEPARPAFPAPGNLLARLLPPDGYAVEKAGDDSEIPEIECAGTAYCLAWREPQRPPPRQHRTTRRQLASFIVWLKSRWHFLGLVTLPNSSRVIALRARELNDELNAAQRVHHAIPEKPEGMFGTLRRRAVYCSEFAGYLANTTATGEPPFKNFDTFIDRVHRKVTDIPNLPGVAWRLALAAIALFWLIASPLVWGSFTSPFADPELNRAFIFSSGLLGFLVLGAAAHWFYFQKRAWRAIEVASEQIAAVHLHDVSRAVTERLRAIGASLKVGADDLISAIDCLRDEWRKVPTAQEPERGANSNPAFTDEGVDRLMSARLATMVLETHTRVASAMQAAANLSAEALQESLAASAHAVAMEHLHSFDFDDFASAQNLLPAERQRMLTEAVGEARRPAWKMQPPPQLRALCLASPTWHAHRGNHDTLGFFHVPSHGLITLSVISIRP